MGDLIARVLANRSGKIDKFGYNLNNGLFNYRVALSNAQNQMVRIYCVGDSITRGEYSSQEPTKSWVGQLRALLQSKYGNAPGEGFIGANEASLPAGAGPRWTFGSGWSSLFAGGMNSLYAKSQGNLTSTSVTFTGTSVTLLYARDTDGGNMNITIDGSAPGSNATINCNNASRDHTQSVTYSGLSAGSHTLTITPASAANALVEGIIPNNNATNGIQMHRLGVSGRRAAQWTNIHYYGRWATLPPHLTILALGLNDASINTTVSDYKASMATLIQQFQSYGSSVLLLAYHQPDITWTPIAPWSSYVQALYELADQYNCGLVDMYQAWNKSFSAATAQGLFGLATNDYSGASGTNTAHPGDKGYNYIAQILQPHVVL